MCFASEPKTLPAAFVCKADVSALAERLKDDALYGEYRFRKDAYVHSDMDDIWVRYNHPANMGHGFHDEHDSVWYPVAAKIPEIFPIVFGLMASVHGERLGGVLITKLPAGGRIKPHIDKSWHASYYRKFFVPVVNGNGARFCWENQVLEPLAGEIWEFDNSVLHWVDNDSDSDRIAMIVCIRCFGD